MAKTGFQFKTNRTRNTGKQRRSALAASSRPTRGLRGQVLLGPSPAGGSCQGAESGTGLLEAAPHREGGRCPVRYQRGTLAPLITAIARRPAPGSCFVPADSSAPPRPQQVVLDQELWVVVFFFILRTQLLRTKCTPDSGTMEEVHNIRGQVMAGYLSHKKRSH